MIGKWIAEIIVASPNVPSDQNFISLPADFPSSYVL